MPFVEIASRENNVAFNALIVRQLPTASQHRFIDVQAFHPEVRQTRIE